MTLLVYSENLKSFLNIMKIDREDKKDIIRQRYFYSKFESKIPAISTEKCYYFCKSLKKQNPIKKLVKHRKEIANGT